MERRALWNAGQSPTPTSTSTTVYCTPFTLPSGGIITLDPSSVLTLAADAVFRPQCTGAVDITLADSSLSGQLKDPFYTSTLPQCYALAATTVIAYMLVIMLFITPRTFLSGGIVVLGRRGFTNGPSGSDAGIGIGGRPWLQKVAALSVAVSLTIASANTFRVAKEQYESGYMDTLALENEVLGSMELQVIRMISDTFLWLAQAQTLIRLFPRQREKVIIKWTAFGLITLNTLFSILTTFKYKSNVVSRPLNIVEAIPAISYLFHLALGLLYGAWVIYYGFTKRTYAFYHPNMRNICLVALMAITSVIVPVVFFILNISKPNVAGWSDYVHWVGAAAASVVVWEWVERIEALERNDKKDGVLGREIFDGDEMLEVTPSSEVDLAHWNSRGAGNSRGGDSSTGASGVNWQSVNRHRAKVPTHRERNYPQGGGHDQNRGFRQTASQHLPIWPVRPQPVATPVSRTNTASAESTVYAVRYHPLGEAMEATNEHIPFQQLSERASFDIEAQPNLPESGEMDSGKDDESKNTTSINSKPDVQHPNRWESIHFFNPFRRKVQEPPPEVSRHTKNAQQMPRNDSSSNRWDVLGKLEDFASVQADKFRDRGRSNHESAPLPVTRIPAPPRHRTLRQITEELDGNEQPKTPMVTAPVVSGESTTAARTSAQQSDAPLSPRPRDLYTPADLEFTTIIHRGNVSFAAPSPRDWDRRGGEATEIMGNPETRSTGSISRTGHRALIGASSQTQSPDMQRLPVMRIPAPPRRARSEG